jgi:hypothetical protein
MSNTKGMILSYGAGLIVGWAVLYHLSEAQFDGAGPMWACLAGLGTSGLVAYLLTFLP